MYAVLEIHLYQQITEDQTNHKIGDGEEIMSSGNINWTTTASTTDCATLTLTNGTDSSLWFPYYMESTWMPYEEEKYYPAYHLLKSYGITKKHYPRFGRVSRFLALVKERFGRGEA